MLVNDALFYLFATTGQDSDNRQGRYMEVTTEEWEVLTGLSNRSVRQQLDSAIQVLGLQQSEGIKPYSLFLKLPSYYQLLTSGAETVIRKPLGFMANGWSTLFSKPPDRQNSAKATRFPLSIVNLLFRKPPGHLTSTAEMIRRTQHPDRKKPPEASDIQKAVQYLKRLGLLAEPKPDQFHLCREQFDSPALPLWQQIQQQPDDPPPDEVIRLRQQDEPRVERTLHLLQIGQLERERYFQEIFYDLAQFRWESDAALIEQVVYKQRHKLNQPDRWQSCRKHILSQIAQQNRFIHTPKMMTEWRTETRQRLLLQWPDPSVDWRQIRWAKLVLWYEDHRFDSCGEPSGSGVKVRLEHAGNVLWQRSLSYETPEMRYDLTTDLKRRELPPEYELFLESDVPLPQVTIKAQLEAQVPG